MSKAGAYHYERIAKAIEYIERHHRSQPDLEQIAAHVHLSPSHFQRVFTEWAGVGPKKFLQYISIDYAKSLLASQPVTLFDVTHQLGLSSTSRLHDLFIRIEGMTPAQYKNGGKGLTINHSYQDSPFGKMLLGSTDRGICYMAFGDESADLLHDLQIRFPAAQFVAQADAFQQRVAAVFDGGATDLEEIKLHLRGSEFQLKVWESLLQIPMGKLSTYGAIAEHIGHSGAARAVGTAVGSNPVAFLIPCHRVIQSSGVLGGYRWDATRKKAIIGWEAAKLALQTDQ